MQTSRQHYTEQFETALSIMNTYSTCKFNSPEGFSFTSHQMIATSQWQAGDTWYVVVNSPEVLLQCQGEQRKQVILLNHLLAQRVHTRSFLHCS